MNFGGEHLMCRVSNNTMLEKLVSDIEHHYLQFAVFFSSARSSETEENKLRKIIENSDLDYILAIIKEEGKEEEAARRYLHDFVHMVYQPSKESQDEEIQVS
jgi:hypothetical protein